MSVKAGVVRTWIALLSCAACGPSPEDPAWFRLALEFDPSDLNPESRSPLITEGGRLYELTTNDEGQWLSTTVKAEDWGAESEPGEWTAPVEAYGRHVADHGPTHCRLESERTTYTFFSRLDELAAEEFAVGSFRLQADGIRLRLEPGVRPPTCNLLVYAGRGHREDGAWRVNGRRFSGEALALWPGESFQCEVDVPPGSVLRFATCVESALRKNVSRRETVFRVVAAGEPVFEYTEDRIEETCFRWHSVPLSAGRQQLRFSVEGRFAYTGFFSAVVGPADVGTYGDRPWGATRPDIVVFLADTFRADNMASYGGEHDVTPNLDRFAANNLVFERAWSVGTYTLPAHASMFSGVFPHQVGIVGTGRALPSPMVTVAEHLAAHGYRTGAITDSVVVTQRYGFDQGFQWFEELKNSELNGMDSTIERCRAFLDADDGRPVFLFVQTYRTHLPYRVSEETRQLYGDRLDLSVSYQSIHDEYIPLRSMPDPRPDQIQRMAQLAGKLRNHYLGGVVDLDRGFEVFRQDLEDRRILEEGYLLFTSDHGEAFGEHGFVFHTDAVFEELARIPLVIAGPGIDQVVVTESASLVDIAPTLTEMAGLDPLTEWLGRSLLSVKEDRPVFVFECQRPLDSTLAMIEANHKVISFDKVEEMKRHGLIAAFNLNRDPHERRIRSEAPWAQDVFNRLAPLAEPLLLPILDPEYAELDLEKLEELEAMGYGGDD